MVRNRQEESENNSNFPERLRLARKDLHLSQKALALKWGYDGNYIYMLEARKKPFPRKLEPRLLELENAVRMLPMEKLDGQRELRELDAAHGTKQRCREHLNKFLEECHDEREKLGWTLYELEGRFPLDKWDGEEVSSETRAAAEASMEEAERTALHESSPQPEVSAPIARKRGQGRDAGKDS